MNNKKVLIAGVGNELKQDDAFGIQFLKSFKLENDFPTNIKLLEVGIGGIHLVQELHYKYDVLILVDAVKWGGNPGHIYFRKMESVSNIEDMSVFDKRTFLADMHYTNPIRALMFAKALNILPKQIYILGCEAKFYNDFAIGMSDDVIKGIPKAIKILKKWLRRSSIKENSLNK